MADDGEWFGRYQLLRRLAFGGMAEIFLAKLRRDEGFEKRVVLKRILPQFCSDPSFVQMFIDEAVLAARIAHPNVVQIYDFGNIEGVYFIAMEYVDGADLRKVLKSADQRALLTAATTAAIGEGVARGLECAHQLRDDQGSRLGLIHRDVSPHNIILSRAGEAKVMDFGIAKAALRVSRTATGTIKGKVAYMSPEQAAGGALDGRCDQFSLGLVLWECLSGERMFAGDSDLEVLQKVVHCQIRDLRNLKPDVPVELSDIVMKMLTADPNGRFATMGDIASLLAAFRFSLGAEGAVNLGDLVAGIAPVNTDTKGRRGTHVLNCNGNGDMKMRQTRSLVVPKVAQVSGVDLVSVETETEAPSNSVASGWEEGEEGEEGPTGSGWEPTVRRHRHSPTVDVRSGQLQSVPAISGGPRVSGRRGRGLFGWLAAGFFVALATLGAIWRLQPNVVRVAVLSTPEGAQILVDGLATGLVTPAEIPDQEVGKALRLGLHLGGFEPWLEVVTPTGSNHVVNATMRSKNGTLAPIEGTLASIESGANTDSGETGSTIEDSEAVTDAQGAKVAPSGPEQANSLGDHKDAGINSDRAGEKRQPASQAKGKRKRASSGSLFLRSTGVWVDVYLGDRKLGTTPLSRAQVPAGVVRLRLVNRVVGVDQIITVDVPEGGEARRTVTPRKRDEP